jgi:pyrroloquinoline quinone biosynthesis protein D
MLFITPMAEISDGVEPRLAKGVRLQTDSVTGKSVLLFPEGIIELNETAHEILSRCDGRTLGEIVRALAEEYNMDPAAIASDVRETFDDLRQRNLLQLI